MEFICSKCGRKDWVFNADAPLCFHCGGPLIGATESYEGRMMSPDFVLHRMTGVVDKHGSVKAGTGRFKREREACATALYALALSESTGKRFWVEVETIDQTPDTRVIQIDQSQRGNILRRQNVEVVDWVASVDDPMDLIRAKCAKAYPPDYCLLIAARSGKLVRPQIIARDIRQISVPFAEIWILGETATNTYDVARLYPTTWQLQFNVLEALERAKTDADVLTKRQRGTETEFVPLGKVYMPIR